MLAADIAARLDADARQDGDDWRCQCPLCGHGNLALRDRGNGLLIKCWNGCTSAAVRAELKRRKLYTAAKTNGIASPETRAEHEARVKSAKAKRKSKRDDARWHWDNSISAVDTMVEVYFASRLILDSPPPSLRFCPAAYRPKAKVNQPHIIGLIEHQTDGVIGVHFIALNPLDASVRVTGDDRKWSKGQVKGGAVRLFPAGPVLALGEGIEDALTFQEATKIPAWAAISADGIRNFVPPGLAVTQTLMLIEDQDKNQAGQRAVADAAPRLAALGYRVKIVRPKFGKDLNDALLELGPGGDLFTTEDYEPNRNGDWYARCTPGENGKPMSNFSNALLALREDPAWRGVLGFDEMAAAATVLRPIPGPASRGGSFPRQLDDLDISRAQEWLQLAGLPWIGRDTVHQALEAVAREHPYNPGQKYLETLAWDGVDRLDDWLTDCLGVEKTEYTMAIGRMFLIAMVARALKPACQADYMLILEGAQSTRKSTACRILGDPWFSDDLPGDVGSRDAALHLRGRWLVEISELHSFTRSEIDALKAFLTRRIDIYRPPYGRKDVEQPRQCMFIGTCNMRVYMTDPTGSRRFWPVATGDIDIDLLASLRDQLFAEAVNRYRAGEQWWPDSDFERLRIAPEQDQRYEEDAWEEPIGEYLRGVRQVTIYEIARHALAIDKDKIGTADQRRIVRILQHLGWRRGKKLHGIYRWVAP
jgi:predicted P-loop ATPase